MGNRHGGTVGLPSISQRRPCCTSTVRYYSTGIYGSKRGNGNITATLPILLFYASVRTCILGSENKFVPQKTTG